MLRPSQRHVEIFVRASSASTSSRSAPREIARVRKSPRRVRHARELNPPRDLGPRRSRQRRILKEKKVDAVNVPDGARAAARMGRCSWHHDGAAGGDSNRSCTTAAATGTSSACRGISSHVRRGLRNILIITGGPAQLGDYPDAPRLRRRRHRLTNMVTRLNHGSTSAGAHRKPPATT